VEERERERDRVRRGNESGRKRYITKLHQFKKKKGKKKKKN